MSLTTHAVPDPLIGPERKGFRRSREPQRLSDPTPIVRVIGRRTEDPMSDAVVDLDRLVEQAWREFREAFADALEALAPGGGVQVAVEASDDPYAAAPYVQAHHVGHAILLEMSGNTCLSPGHKLSRKGQRDLRGLGLRRPSKDAPNYEASYPLGHVDEAASVVVSAFRRAFGVMHPAFLVSDDVAWQTYPLAPTADAAPAPAGAVAVHPVSREHLDRLIDQALTPVFGHAPRRDSDGDIPVRSGSAVVFVSNLWPRPCVRLFAELVVDVGRPIRAVHELGVLNHDETISALAVRLRDWVLEHLEGVHPDDADAVSDAISSVVRRIVLERADSKEPTQNVLVLE